MSRHVPAESIAGRPAHLINLTKLANLMPMSSTYSIGEAKTQLSKLVRQAEEGEDVVLRRGSQPVARLVALASDHEAAKRTPGRMRGRVSVPEDFDEWPQDIAAALGISP
jgi:antitoxin (DNA-binding transcriptional repressor) of toxin-antitoxin stability system